MVRRIRDWRRLRDLRLLALAEAPYAFGSTLAREQAFGEAEWTSRCREAVWVAAWRSDVAVGLACLGPAQASEPSCRRIFSMWVAPAARGGSTAGALLQFLTGWAAAEGYTVVRLHVVAGNPRAFDLYSRHGFHPTGTLEAIGGDPQVSALELQLDLA
ncbi:MAG: GNAT family N-acetyltransferase [Candidatus Dormibacteria bacterium]